MRKSILLLFSLLLMVASLGQAYANTELKLVADSAVVMDLKSGEILYGKNEEKLQHPASITKILTAIVAIENGKLEDRVTISKKAASMEGSTTYIEEGEQISLEQLLHGLLMQSGNDAATAIAEHIGGSEEAFAEMMNETARKAGATQSHFMNPHGLDHEQHKVTAKDMALITQYAMKNPTFREFFGTKEYRWESKSWNTTLHNKHKLLTGVVPSTGVTGGKTGYTQIAGQTLVTTASKDGMDIVVVVLKSVGANLWSDTNQLINYAFTRYKSVQLATKNQQVSTLSAENSEKYKKWVLEQDVYGSIDASLATEITKEYGQLGKAVSYKINAEPRNAEGKIGFYIKDQLIKEAKILHLERQNPFKDSGLSNKHEVTVPNLSRNKLYVGIVACVLMLAGLNAYAYMQNKGKSRRKLRGNRVDRL